MKSDAINEIAMALAAADLPNPKKTHTANAGTYRYQYAPLSEVVDSVRKPLADQGLSYTQIVQHSEAGSLLTTLLMHKSGQWISGQYPLPKGLGSQDMGKAISYARRYSLCAILGIAAEDDDGAGPQRAEDAQKEEEAEAKREEARKRLEAAKAQGRVKDAYTGKPLAPGEEPQPESARPEPKPEKVEPPKDDGIAPDLKALMVKDGITAKDVKAFYVAKQHFQASMEVAALPADYVKLITRVDNWMKVKAFARNGV